MSDLDKRITDLENMNIEKRLIILEERINIIHLDHNNLKGLLLSIAEDFGSTRPFKCHVCNGRGKGLAEAFEERSTDSQGRHFISCRSCEGKGIVWGIK